MAVRTIGWFSVACLIALLSGASGVAAHAQSALKNNDISVGGLYQFTGSTSGNGVSDHPTKSAGGEASFRHSYHWWLGWEASYNYTRFSENYSNHPFGVQHNLHDFGGSYYVHGATALGIQPFAVAGVSALVFSPSLNGGQNVSWQVRPGANFGGGVNFPLVTGHFGVRLEYRGVYYKTPDFGLPQLTTNAYRLTSEPQIGLYLKF